MVVLCSLECRQSCRIQISEVNWWLCSSADKLLLLIRATSTGVVDGIKP